MKYFLKKVSENDWREVAKEEYLEAKEKAGFKLILGWEELIAVAPFDTPSISGKIGYNKKEKRKIERALERHAAVEELKENIECLHSSILDLQGIPEKKIISGDDMSNILRTKEIFKQVRETFKWLGFKEMVSITKDLIDLMGRLYQGKIMFTADIMDILRGSKISLNSLLDGKVHGQEIKKEYIMAVKKDFKKIIAAAKFKFSSADKKIFSVFVKQSPWIKSLNNYEKCRLLDLWRAKSKIFQIRGSFDPAIYSFGDLQSALKLIGETIAIIRGGEMDGLFFATNRSIQFLQKLMQQKQLTFGICRLKARPRPEAAFCKYG
jgi:hypothetical protein